jgi:hypothetical protein
MSVPAEHERHCTSDPICPYCGEEQGDFWEVSGEDGDYDCGHCTRRFRWSRYIDVTYNTDPIIGPHQLDEYTIRSEAEDTP